MANKYSPLTNFLAKMRGEFWDASFAEVEAVLGFKLPPSAQKYPAWWSNDPSDGRHSRSWLDAGWETENLNLTGRKLTFRRGGAGIKPTTQPNVELPSKADRLRAKTRRQNAPILDLHQILKKLAVKRPVFHSEADFQHALAWIIHLERPDLELRLEYRPKGFGRRYIDLCVASADRRQAIELKYFTTRLECEHDGEEFSLLQQGAQDISRYDFLKDVERLEEYVRITPKSSGSVVAITNDRAYWSAPRSASTVDAAFRLHDGRCAQGVLDWAAHTGTGTKKGRERPIHLAGAYDLVWSNYSSVKADRRSAFRYLAVEVD